MGTGTDINTRTIYGKLVYSLYLYAFYMYAEEMKQECTYMSIDINLLAICDKSNMKMSRSQHIS